MLTQALVVVMEHLSKIIISVFSINFGDIFLLLPLKKCTSLTVWFLDHVSGISNGDGSQENKVNIESKPVVDMPLDAHPPKDNNGMPLIGNTEASEVQNQSEINHLKFMLVVIIKFLSYFRYFSLFLFRIAVIITCYYPPLMQMVFCT